MAKEVDGKFMGASIRAVKPRRARPAARHPVAPDETLRGAGVDRRRLGAIAALGTAQALACGSSYYLPAILTDPIARDLGISSNWFFAAFSGSLVISGLLGPRVSRQNRPRRRPAGALHLQPCSRKRISTARSLGFGLDDVGSLASTRRGYGLGLYDAAFGTLGRIYGRDARSAITGITLIAGFASTVAWP
jgi:hypothetical protein